MAAQTDTAARYFGYEAQENRFHIKDATSDNSTGDAEPPQQLTKQPAAMAACPAACAGAKALHCAPADNDCSDSLHMDTQQYLFDASTAYDSRRPTFLLLEDDEEEDEQQQRQQQQQQQRHEQAWQQRPEKEETEEAQRQQQQQQQQGKASFLELDNAASNDSTSFMELAHCEDLGRNGSCQAAAEPAPERQLYRLVLIDEATGQPLRPATEEDAEQLARLMSSSCESGADGSGVCSWPPFRMESGPEVSGGEEEGEEGAAGGSHDSQRSVEVVSGLAPAAGAGGAEAGPPAQQPLRPFHHKAGGPCNHCGVKDSPQWRRGPSNKPILCNACGTRFRRTNQLGPPIPSSGKAANRKRVQGGGGGGRRPTTPKSAKKAAGASPRG